MQIHNVEQGTEEWLSLRRKHRSASESAMAMQISKFGGWEKLKKIKDGTATTMVTPAMRHGNETEAQARQAYCFDNETEMPPIVCTKDGYLASLDGYNAEDETVLEIKCPFTGVSSATWKTAQDGLVEPMYMAQIQHQLMVTGAKKGVLYVYDDAAGAGVSVDVFANHDMWQEIKEAWDAFEKWSEGKDGNHTYELSAAYVAAKEAFDEAKIALDAAKDAVTAMAKKDMELTGIKSAEYGSLLITECERKGSVAYGKVPELDGVDVEQYRGAPSTSLRITVKKGE